jgi:L-2-hydroxyglutarate oxidase LhgO
MPDTGVVVIGAGVVGLAIAAELAQRGAEVVVLERNERHGMETSSRNSEVIHAGLYYPATSLKATLCVEGNRRLYDLCAARGIAHRRTGKIITALDDSDVEGLDALHQRARENGVHLERLTAAAVHALEPSVRSVGGLLSPSSGIVSAHELMDALRADAERAGAIIQTRSEVTALERTGDWRVEVRGPGGNEAVTTDRVINAAGLDSDAIAALAGIDIDAAGYRLHWAKGSYFAARPARAQTLSHLVYPLPSNESLGVHAVLGIDGRIRFGPDIDYLPERIADYAVDETRRAAFAASVRRWLPDLHDEELSPDIAGIRPKLQAPGEPVRDFVIREETDRGLAGLINLLGIDSPGLTAALAIAQHVAAL